MIRESSLTAGAVRSRAQPLARLRWWPDSEVWAKVRRERWMYAFIVPGFIFFVVFRYVPLLGNIVAFEDYSPYLGFFESPWVGFDNFAALFTNPAVGSALLNTLIINGLQILCYFPTGQRRNGVLTRSTDWHSDRTVHGRQACDPLVSCLRGSQSKASDAGEDVIGGLDVRLRIG